MAEFTIHVCVTNNTEYTLKFMGKEPDENYGSGTTGGADPGWGPINNGEIGPGQEAFYDLLHSRGSMLNPLGIDTGISFNGTLIFENILAQVQLDFSWIHNKNTKGAAVSSSYKTTPSPSRLGVKTSWSYNPPANQNAFFTFYEIDA